MAFVLQNEPQLTRQGGPWLLSVPQLGGGLPAWLSIPRLGTEGETAGLSSLE